MDQLTELKPQIPAFLANLSKRPIEEFVRIKPGLMGEVYKSAIEHQGQGFRKYDITHNGSNEPSYIIWWNTDALKDMYSPIPQEEWQELVKDPDTMNRVDEVLLRAKATAKDFYPWTAKSTGLSIVNNDEFGLEKTGPFGIRVSYPNEIKDLIDAIRSGDAAKVKELETHLGASLVHEYIHLERDDGLAFGNSINFEMVTHIGQFLYDPKGNAVFRRQIHKTLENIKKDGVQGNAKVYDVGTYTALVLLANELQKINPAFKEMLEKDLEPYKAGTLEQLPDFVDSKMQNKLKADLLKRAIATDAKVLAQERDQILGSWEKLE